MLNFLSDKTKSQEVKFEYTATTERSINIIINIWDRKPYVLSKEAKEIKAYHK